VEHWVPKMRKVQVVGLPRHRDISEVPTV